MKEIVIDFLRGIFSFDQAHPMIFTQFHFWVFFAIVLAFLCVFHRRTLLRNAFLFACSLFFYFKTSGLCVALLLFVVVANYLFGLFLERKDCADGKEGASGNRGRKAVLAAAVVLDLMLLGYYKYAYFLSDLCANIFGTAFPVRDVFAVVGNRIAGKAVFGVDDIILPVGISFFTFQAISYVVDVYRGRIPCMRNFLDFGFYLTFFPALVAGPIVRASDFAPQIHRPFFLSRRHFGLAVFWILNGLAKKLILSDYIAVNFCDRVFANPLLFTGFENVAALLGYSLQIYADFSGYTDVAIGVAMLMGFHLPKNFDSPYKAENPVDFWRRWHISLSSWLKDYLYIPLGGNRNSTPATFIVLALMTLVCAALVGSWLPVAIVAALSVLVGAWAFFRKDRRKAISANLNRIDTMLLGGLWHGASGNFILWGGLNGLGMVVYQYWKNAGPWLRVVVTGLVSGALYAATCLSDAPILRLLFYWIALIFAGCVVAATYSLFAGKEDRNAPSGFAGKVSHAWAILLNFIFITFTWLFFRSASGLPPAQANQAAWETATSMISMMTGKWNLSVIPDIIRQYDSVFAVILFGLAIHLLPDRFKRRYRIWFSSMPLWLMAVVSVAVIFFIYQFVTADLKAFIYFQF